RRGVRSGPTAVSSATRDRPPPPSDPRLLWAWDAASDFFPQPAPLSEGTRPSPVARHYSAPVIEGPGRPPESESPPRPLPGLPSRGICRYDQPVGEGPGGATVPAGNRGTGLVNSRCLG